MQKCFERTPDQHRGPQQERLVEDDHQPIRNQRQVSDTESRHFQNQQPPPAHNITRPTKLVDQLRPSFPTSKIPGADSRIPTIISGRERANRLSPTPAERIPNTFAKKSSSDQVRTSSRSRFRSPSSNTPATRSTSRAEAFTHEVEEVARMKYSAVHGLGEQWKTPLIYPKTGKRRMTVEYDDLYRLDEDEFLNDNLIGFYLRYLEYHLEQTNSELAQRVYFYNSYFFERLMQNSKGKKGIDYESVQKWTRNIDIFDRDFVVVPVNESYHWYVVIICNLSRVNSLADDDGEDVATEVLPSMKPALFSTQREDETQEELAEEESQDQPTEKTTNSLSQLSLSDADQQLDELAPTSKAFSSFLSPHRVSTPRKTGSGRRKPRRSLRQYDPSAPMIITFDSLGVPRSSTCTALRQYMVEEASNKKGWVIDGTLIKGMTARGIPTQANYSDCGLYLCAYLEKFILDPAGFVRKILRREMDPKMDMPMMTSKELRSRMRGLIRGLHNEQESKEVEFPIPEIGRILLAPSPRAVSEDDSHAPRTPLQDDSEDELQRDQTNARVLNAVGSLRREPTPPTPPTSRPSEDNAPSTRRLSREDSRWNTSTSVKDVLAKINKIAPSSVNSKSGTRETAITIDDDEDSTPSGGGSSAKKTPVAKDAFLEGDSNKIFSVYDDASQLVVESLSTKNPSPRRDPLKRGSGKKIAVHTDDFFEHPSELKNPARVRNTSTPRRKAKQAPKELLKEAPMSMELPQRRRSQSIASAATADTDYLSGRGNKSYQHVDDDEDGQDAGRLTTADEAENDGQSPDMAVMIPDSQENTEGEVEVERSEVENQKGTGHEPQMILEGIE
jgi:Ulp1 family protease